MLDCFCYEMYVLVKRMELLLHPEKIVAKLRYLCTVAVLVVRY